MVFPRHPEGSKGERELHFETARKYRTSSVRAEGLLGVRGGGVKCEYQRRIVRRAMARSHFVS